MATAKEVLAGGKRWCVEQGDCLAVLSSLPAGSVQCCCTSPPYFGLRDYGSAGQIGLEKSPAEYVAALVAVFEEVRRVLRDDGVLWLNIGDSYSGGGGFSPDAPSNRAGAKQTTQASREYKGRAPAPGFKPKDLLGVPWLLAFALRDAGWFLRSDCLWLKASPMPESVRDRPTRSHEYVFLFAKKAKYFYDQDAELVPLTTATTSREAAGYKAAFATQFRGSPTDKRHVDGKQLSAISRIDGRNLWTAWDDIPPSGLSGEHFAAFPPGLPRRCIRLGTSEHGCCPACGTPWRRVVERKRVATRPGRDTKTAGKGGLEIGNRDPERHVTTRRQAGWEAGCKCGVESREECVVLDPFCGSGTTGIVARGLQRRFIGIELNPQYAELSRRRIGDATPLLDAAEAAEPVLPSLFDGLDEAAAIGETASP